MPTYAYRCTACEHRFEQSQRFADDPLTECPECGGQLRRQIGPVGVVFKGSGWYITDSRKPAGDGTDKTAKTDKKTDVAKASETAKTATTESKKAEPAAVAAD